MLNIYITVLYLSKHILKNLETAGVEPASYNTHLQPLHVYPVR